MTSPSRRQLLAMAAALGAGAAWAGPSAAASRLAWREQRELYPEGVASGDPTATGVILWTRRPFAEGRERAVEIFETEFVAIPRPLERSAAPDGGPLAYRVRHAARLWRPGERPALTQTLVEGTPPLAT